MLLPNTHYNVEIAAASMMESQVKNTPGLQLSLRVFEGEGNGQHISHTLWLSKKTLDGTQNTLMSLGVTSDELKKESFWDNVGSALIGKRCRITTIEEEHKGKTTTKVAWLNPLKAASSGSSLSATAAKLFGGAPKSQSAALSDEEVPF